MTKQININKNELNRVKCEVASTINDNIHETFKINVKNGNGYYETGINKSFWSKLTITAKIINPKNGTWSIIIRDKTNRNIIVYEEHQVMPNKEITFSYKTGLNVNFLIETIWSENKDTTLTGEISIKY